MNKKIIPAVLSVLVIFVSCVPGLRRDGWFSSGGSRKSIVVTAKRYIGVKYKKGGVSPAGFDCSGYVWYVYNKNGIDLPRTSHKQFYAGKKISIRQAKPGDLIFFNTTGKSLSHVGIYLGGTKFIHSPRSGKKVSYADINNKYWKRRYAGSVTFLRS
ncbi:MAG: C40 family peptidase [Spirochaetes bacterium]|jgi:cell wall-associated NlpC family hydrolase|nr:C40 family peptidase [Spirochaetota bacterium]